MSAVDSTIVLLALLPLAEEIHANHVTMVWVVIAHITLAPNYVIAYHSGQSFAFELSATLLILATLFSLIRGKGKLGQFPVRKPWSSGETSI